MQTYPQHPGYKVGGPSQEAAVKIAPKAKTLRDQVVEAFTYHQRIGLTADELAGLLNSNVLSIRPRVSELFRLGIIEDTKTRRTNQSGSTVTVWRLK